ncbi:hypothetical protein [Lysinibacillus xylanilyticus]|uniref:PIN domain-containing protein n=1 Tax=Lysinibacillus xylanilyticus TaxID=582475 RepID=A0A2M9Q9W5_9BACI|nr:hypothetical protein [Lysinibacillus xylanilyticus]PJO44859.1 hypothetical protein CWD94_04005 [Lysinibacillus xylanilyticus]
MKEVTLPISSSCFVDANIIFYIDKLKDKADFINVLEKVYESVYIHEEVYKELSSSSQKFVDNKCQDQKWILLNPLQEFKTTYSDYQLMLTKIQEKLIEVDKRRGKEGSVGTGEIASLAAAYMLNAEIICSNDYSLEDVIVEVPLHIFINGNEESDPVYIKHHRLLDFCELVVFGNVLKRSEVRKFYQIAHIELKQKKPEVYKLCLTEFDERIPAEVTLKNF